MTLKKRGFFFPGKGNLDAKLVELRASNTHNRVAACEHSPTIPRDERQLIPGHVGPLCTCSVDCIVPVLVCLFYKYQLIAIFAIPAADLVNEMEGLQRKSAIFLVIPKQHLPLLRDERFV